jgi:hypothetical protein
LPHHGREPSTRLALRASRPKLRLTSASGLPVAGRREGSAPGHAAIPLRSCGR